MAIGTKPEDLFVGRTEILENLSKALRRAAKGQGRLHMLVGEPGIGKTRLAELDELVRPAGGAHGA